MEKEVENKIVVKVRDEGPGFTIEDQRQLYRKFQRLSARPTGGESSTGLGLSIVKALVEKMNGELICQSEEGNGATFIVKLEQSDELPGKNISAVLENVN